ncbi:MAG: hypothetical protein Edafosvirus52_2 [Edafosvirus sp.]|uniref:Sel1 repeat protein n=1 Tax=Edafosvirus sp. TaxID=2487765 RepID=A0A3G4ZVJ7_9VIRU|nr:MAG: hypothetical protein Edafosvirus52_2 [Edafosvirus sp.]
MGTTPSRKKQCKILAEKNDIDAMLELAGMYENTNRNKANILYKKLAELGNERGMEKLGDFYKNEMAYGINLEQNRKEAIKWYDKVKLTNIACMYKLGMLYRDNNEDILAIDCLKNVTENIYREESINLYTTYKYTEYYLAEIYEKNKDYDKAIFHYENLYRQSCKIELKQSTYYDDEYRIMDRCLTKINDIYEIRENDEIKRLENNIYELEYKNGCQPIIEFKLITEDKQELYKKIKEFMSFGFLYKAKKEYILALDYFETVIDIIEKEQLYGYRSECLNAIDRIYKNIGGKKMIIERLKMRLTKLEGKIENKK